METHPANGPTCIFKVRTCCLGGWGILPLHFTKLWPPKFMKKKKVITCCKRCAKKIKKKLQEIGDVNSITIDYENGMVAVSGEVDPATLLVAISKLKVSVELVSYKKDTRRIQKNKQAERSKNKHKKDYHKDENQAKNKQKDHHKDKDSKNISHGAEHSHSNSDPYSEDDFGEGPNFSAHKNGKPSMKGPLVAPPHVKGYLPNSGSQFRPPMPSRPQFQWGSMMYGRPPLGPPRALPLPPPPMPPPLAYGYNNHLGMVPPPPYGYDHHSSMVLGPRPPPSQIHPYNYNPRPRKTPVGNSMLHYFSDDNTTSSGCTIM